MAPPCWCPSFEYVTPSYGKVAKVGLQPDVVGVPAVGGAWGAVAGGTLLADPCMNTATQQLGVTSRPIKGSEGIH